MKATQLEACLKKEEQELVWRKEVESLFAELQLMKQEKKELKVKLKKAEHKNGVLQNDLYDLELEMKKKKVVLRLCFLLVSVIWNVPLCM
ncbi:unnamed protein product [Urochloa humidicola]